MRVFHGPLELFVSVQKNEDIGVTIRGYLYEADFMMTIAIIPNFESNIHVIDTRQEVDC